MCVCITDISSVVLIVLSWVVLLSLALSLPPFFHFTRDNRCYRITLKTWRKSLFLSKIRARLWSALRANNRHRSLFPETLLVCGRKTPFAFRPTHGGEGVLGVARTFTSRCDWSVYRCHNSSSFRRMEHSSFQGWPDTIDDIYRIIIFWGKHISASFSKMEDGSSTCDLQNGWQHFQVPPHSPPASIFSLTGLFMFWEQLWTFRVLQRAQKTFS